MITHTRTFTTCGHNPDKVVADVLQGDGDHGQFPIAVQWCRVCGAYKIVFRPHGDDRSEGEWHEPEGPDGEGVRFY